MLSLRLTSRRTLLVFTGLFLIFVASLMFLIWPAETAGVAYVWDGGGSTSNWSENANWSPDGQPGSADTVTFNGTSTKASTIDAGWAGTVSSISIASGYTNTVTAARSLTVNTTFTQAAGTFTGGSQAIIIKTNFTLSAGTFNNTTETATGGLRIERNFTHSGGTFNGTSTMISFIDDSVSDSSTFTCGSTFNSVSATNPRIVVTKDNGSTANGFALSTNASGCVIYTDSISLTGSGGVVTVNANATLNTTSTTTLHALTVAASGTFVTNQTSLTLKGDVSVTGTMSIPSTTTLNFEGNLTLNSAATTNIPNWSSATVNFIDDGSGDSSIVTCASGSLNSSGNTSPTISVIKDASSSNNGFTLSTGSTCTVNLGNTGSLTLAAGAAGTFTVNSGVTAAYTGSISVHSLTVSGALSQTGTSLTLSGNMTVNTGGTFTPPASTTYSIEKNLTYNGTISNWSSATVNLVDNGTGDDVVLTCNGSLNSVGNTSPTITIVKDAGSAGNFVTFTAGTSGSCTVYLGDITVTSGGALTVNSGVTVVSTGDVTPGTSLTVSGTLTTSDTSLNIPFNLTISGTLNLADSTTLNIDRSFTCTGGTLGTNFATSTLTFTSDTGADDTTYTCTQQVGNISIQKDISGALFTQADHISVGGNFSASLLSAYINSATYNDLSVSGSVTLTANASTAWAFDLVANGTSTSSTYTNTSGAEIAGEFRLEGGAITKKFTLSSGLAPVGSCTLTRGTLSRNGQNFTCPNAIQTLLTADTNIIYEVIGTEVETGTWPHYTGGALVRFIGDGDGAADNYTLSGSATYRTTYPHLEIAAIDAGDTFAPANPVSIYQNFTMTSGILNMGIRNTTFLGATWTRTGGTYTAGTGTVSFEGATEATIVGDTTFSNLRLNYSSVASKTVLFTAGSTTTVTGTLEGPSSGSYLLTIGSTSNGSAWNLNATSSPSLIRTIVKDSDASSGASIDCLTSCTNNGNNTNWRFTAAGITVSTISGNTTEAGGTATFTVVLDDAPSDDVVIGLTSNDTSEGTVSPSSLTFTTGNWSTPQTVTVTGVDDDLDDGDVAYSVVTAAATSNDGNYNTLNPSDASVTNTDNDTSGFTVSAISGNTTEAGGTATFTVVLTAQPTADVSTGITSNDTSEGTVSPSSLTFTSVNWAAPQTVTVTGVNDDLDDGDVVYSVVTAAASSGDSNYNNLNPADASVTNTDNDTSGFTVSAISGNTYETGGSSTFTVVLTAQPTANVVVGITSSDTSEGTVSPSSLTFTSANWSTPQTVSVFGVDDLLADGDIDYSVVTAAATSSDNNYNGLNPGDVSVTNINNDTAAVFILDGPGSISESGSTDTLRVGLNTQPSADVTISFSSSDTGEGTVSPSSLTFTAINWLSTQDLTLTGVDDSLDDGNIEWTVVTSAASSSDPSYNDLAVEDATATTTDNDTSGFTVSAISGNTTEAGGTATFTVVLTAQPTADVSTGITSNDTSEGTVSPSSLTFTSANWSTPQTVTVTGVNDDLDDGDVAYSIVTAAASSSDVDYSAINPDDVSVTNTDNDDPSIVVVTTPLVTTESGMTDTFTVVLGTQPSASVSLGLSSSDTSEATVSPSSLTFTTGNWNTPQTVTVTGVDDALDDGDIEYTIITAAATSADSSYNNVNPDNVVGTNEDNDAAGVSVSTLSNNTTESGVDALFQVVLGTEPTDSVSMSVTSSDTTEGTVSAGSLTFTTGNWSTPQTVTVTGVDDVIIDGNINYSILLGTTSSNDPAYNNLSPDSVSAINMDNDSASVQLSAISRHTTEAGQAATFTMTMASQPSADVSISLTSSNTNEGTVSPSSVTFTSLNWLTPQTVTVTGVDDAIVDGTITYYIQTGNAVSGDSNYNGLAIAEVAVQNDDDDVGVVEPSAISGSTTEGEGTATFTVVLTSQPAANVIVPLSTSDATEGTVSPSSLTFTTDNWNTPQTVTVTGVNDDLDDGDTAYSIVLGTTTSSDAPWNGQNPADVSVTNADNDAAGITISAISGSVSESGAAATFTVSLTTRPESDVSIDLSSSDLTEGTVSPSSITFTPADWSTPQTVTVTGVDDLIEDGNQNFSITTATSISLDENFNGINPSDVAVTNLDNDSVVITVTPTDETNRVSENGLTDTYTIVLGSEPSASVVLALTDDDQINVSPSTITFTPEDYLTPQTVTISAQVDALVEGSHAGAVSYAVTSDDDSYNNYNLSNTIVQVTDRRKGVGYVAPVTSSIKVTAPAGEKIYAGSISAIRWETTGPDFFVNIKLSIDAGVTWQTIASGLRNSGEYLWLVPDDMRSPEAYIEVELTDFVAIVKADRTDLPLEILPPITDAPSLVDPSPIIEAPETWSGPGFPSAWIGMFVKAPSSHTVYLLADDGTKRPFLDQSIFFTYADSFSSVIEMPAIMLDGIPVGRPMLPAFGSLVKETSDPTVYLVSIKESIFRLESESQARQLFGWDWASRVIDLPSSLFQWFTRLN